MMERIMSSSEACGLPGCGGMLNRNCCPALLFFLGLQAVYPATLSGKLSEESGSAIAGARVTLFNPDTTYFRETRSGASGTYTLDELPDGSFKIGAAAIGREYIEVSKSVAGADLTQDFSLPVETQPGKWDVVLSSVPAALPVPGRSPRPFRTQ